METLPRPTMIHVRRQKERLAAFDKNSDCEATHCFDFADLKLPACAAHGRNFRSCRVLNEDRLAAGGRGFDEHGHAEYEIFSVVLAGRLRHADDLGNGADVPAGAVQLTSAGTGVRHSERNASKDDECHLLQIWVEPNEAGLAPSHECRDFRWLDRPKTLLLSPTAAGGSLRVRAEVYVWGCCVDGEDVALASPFGRDAGWAVAHTTRGACAACGGLACVAGGETTTLQRGDTAFVDAAAAVVLRGAARATVVVLAFGDAPWAELSVQDKWARFLDGPGTASRRLAASLGS